MPILTLIAQLIVWGEQILHQLLMGYQVGYLAQQPAYP